MSDEENQQDNDGSVGNVGKKPGRAAKRTSMQSMPAHRLHLPAADHTNVDNVDDFCGEVDDFCPGEKG
jgi:hypothetical protein